MFVISVHTNPHGPATASFKVHGETKALKALNGAKAKDKPYIMNLWREKKGQWHWIQQRQVK